MPLLTTRLTAEGSASLRLRWFVMHGIVRAVAKRWAAAGDLQSMLIDGDAWENPVAIFERIRAGGALNRTKLGFITADHAIVHQVLRSDDFRAISLGANLPPLLQRIERRTRPSSLHPLRPPSLLATEPPDHTRYRSLVSSVFTARAVAALRDNVQQKANELLDELAGGDVADIVERYCAQLPVAIISDILGVPEADRARVLEFGELAAPSLDIGLNYRQFVSVERGLGAFDGWLSQHLAGLRRNPGSDLLSQLVHASQDGQYLNDSELRATAGLVLAAGFETTVNLLGNGIKLLLEHPAELARLQAEPQLWGNAVDEVLRMDSPVQVTARLACNPVDIAGVRIPAGAMVSLLLAGANRDPKIFDDPHRFDVGRANAAKHLSFSGGRHFCLGAALARAEGEVGLRTLFERFPQLALAGPGVRRPTRVLRGWASLPVRLAAETPLPVPLAVG